MNEDPTRIMRRGDGPERRRSPQPQKPRGNMRLVVAVMGAVIFGLFIALLVSGGGGETKTVTVTHQVTKEVEAKTEKGESAAEKEAKEAEEGEEGESGGIEEFEPEGTEEESGGIEEVTPEEEAGGIEEVAPEEEKHGGVEAE